jgi:hypothetical protein
VQLATLATLKTIGPRAAAFTTPIYALGPASNHVAVQKAAIEALGSMGKFDADTLTKVSEWAADGECTIIGTIAAFFAKAGRAATTYAPTLVSYLRDSGCAGGEVGRALETVAEPSEVAQQLRSLLKDATITTRIRVYEALKQAPGLRQSMGADIVNWLGESDSQTREIGMLLIREGMSLDDDNLRRIAGWAKQPELCCEAVQTLAFFGSRASPYANVVEPLLSWGDAAKIVAAARSLGAMETVGNSEKRLVELLKSPSDDVRSAACMALSGSREVLGRNVDSIASLLGTESTAVAAMEAIARLGPTRVCGG